MTVIRANRGSQNINLLTIFFALALSMPSGCVHEQIWKEAPVSEWQGLLDQAGEDLPYWERHLYYGMPEAELLSAMGPPTSVSTDLRPFKNFDAPASGRVLTWRVGQTVLLALVDGDSEELVELLNARAGTRQAKSVLETRAEVFGGELEPGTDLVDIVRLLKSPDEVWIWPKGAGMYPEMAGQLVLVYYYLRAPLARLFFVDARNYKLLEGPWDLTSMTRRQQGLRK
jgi:hypothetical protein